MNTTTLQDDQNTVKPQIVLIKLFGGDLMLGELADPPVPLSPFVDLDVRLNNPRMIAIAPTMTGQVRIALGSICEPFKVKRLKEFISIPKSQIMFQLNEDEIDSELINGYKSEISGLKMPSIKDTIDFAN